MSSLCSSLYRISRRVGSRDQWGVLFEIGESKKFAFYQTRKFSKNVKNQWKNYIFGKFFKEILRFFENVVNILSKFSRKFREKFRKFWKYGFIWVRGADPPEASENIFKKLGEKSMEAWKFWKFSRIFSEFWLLKANFNKNYGNFDGILKL